MKVQTYASPNRYTLYGNTLHNNFECNTGKDCIMYGGGGADEFYKKIQPEVTYIKDFKQNDNDADKIYLPNNYSNIKANQSSDNTIGITATYTKEVRRGTATKYVNVILEDTHWSLEDIGEWVSIADGSYRETEEGKELSDKKWKKKQKENPIQIN